MKGTILVILIICGIGLIQTNPGRDENYVDHVSKRLGETLCQPEFSDLKSIEELKLFTPLAMKGLVIFNTEPSKNYWLFTTYTTKLPGCTLHGIGIAGQFMVWSSHHSSSLKRQQ